MSKKMLKILLFVLLMVMGACSFIFLKETKPDAKNKESMKKEKVVSISRTTFTSGDEKGNKIDLV